MTLIQEIRRRWRAESPELFKKLSRFWAVIVGISLAMVGMELAQIDVIKEALPLSWRPWFDKVNHYALIVSAINYFTSRLPVKNPNDLARPGDNPVN